MKLKKQEGEKSTIETTTKKIIVVEKDNLLEKIAKIDVKINRITSDRDNLQEMVDLIDKK